MAAEWFRRMYDRGFYFPESYLVFDVETTGLKVTCDYIVQLGHIVVENRVCRKESEVILDWTRCDRASHGDVRQRIYEAEYDLGGKGRDYKFSYKRIATDGVDPIAVLEAYYDFFTQHQNAGCYFLTHNGYRYDSKIISSHFSRFLGCDFQIDHNLMIDTGLLEKAQLAQMILRDGESLTSFYNRVSKEFAKVPWSLEQHCVPKYKLQQRHNLDMRKAHTAAFDCYLTHLLMEEFRRLVVEGD